MSISDFSIYISTENGTGSFTANKVFLRSLLKSGFSASSKNLFPSNIAGLPTNYKIRVHKQGFSSINQTAPDVFVAFNKKTFDQDLQQLDPKKCLLIYNENFKKEHSFKEHLGLDCRSLVRSLHDSASVKKLLYNMIYVGVLAKVCGLKLQVLTDVTQKLFSKLKEDVLEANLKALKVGYETEGLKSFGLEKSPTLPPTHLVDGNTASALGFLDGGAQVATWYPITPSSSVVETFSSLNKNVPSHSTERSVVQCEDEISSAVAALGAGWSGARAFTATSGPGLSLMQEAIGLSYYAEIPLVILDVQRLGPSTGLPTRTSQADLNFAYNSSHGDGSHPVFLPGTPQEAYEDAFDSLNLAQDLQSPVFILSDLDLGMNEWSTHALKRKNTDLSSGKLQTECDETPFKRYSNKNLVSSRSLPRLGSESLAHFTRGSGHDEFGHYSESPKVYKEKVLRLKKKIQSLRELSSFTPKDAVQTNDDSQIGFVVFGSSQQILPELLKTFKASYYRPRMLPLSQDLQKFIDQHDKIFVIEQNRDHQLMNLIKADFDCSSTQMLSVLQFDGQPLAPDFVIQSIQTLLKRTS